MNPEPQGTPIWWTSTNWARSHRTTTTTDGHDTDHTICGQHIRGAMYHARPGQPRCRNCLKVLGVTP